MYYVYILYSQNRDVYYTGHTGDIDDRLSRHNSGRSKSTRSGVPWELKWKYARHSRSETMKLRIRSKR
jgi:putative endonuclease